MNPHAPTFSVHWLTLTTSRPVEEVLAQRQDWGVVEDRGGFGQPRRIVSESGLVVYFGSRRDDQPVVIVASGEVCERLPVADVLRLGDKLTRFDVAADVMVEGSREFILGMRDAAREGRLTGPFRAISLIDSDGPGEGVTLYLGSPNSGQRLRVYNRRGPVRFEFQVRVSRVASEFLRHMLVHRFDELPSLWRGYGEDFKWEDPVWASLMAGPAVVTPRVPEPVPEFAKAVGALRAQYGVLLSMLERAGFVLADFVDDRIPSPAAVNRLARIAASITDEEARGKARNVVEDFRFRLAHRRAHRG